MHPVEHAMALAVGELEAHPQAPERGQVPRETAEDVFRFENGRLLIAVLEDLDPHVSHARETGFAGGAEGQEAVVLEVRDVESESEGAGGVEHGGGFGGYAVGDLQEVGDEDPVLLGVGAGVVVFEGSPVFDREGEVFECLCGGEIETLDIAMHGFVIECTF